MKHILAIVMIFCLIRAESTPRAAASQDLGEPAKAAPPAPVPAERQLQAFTGVSPGDVFSVTIDQGVSKYYVIQSPEDRLFPIRISVTPQTGDPDLYVSCDVSFLRQTFSANPSGVDAVMVDSINMPGMDCVPGSSIYIRVLAWRPTTCMVSIVTDSEPFDGTVLSAGATPIAASLDSEGSASFAVAGIHNYNLPVDITVAATGKDDVQVELTCNSVEGDLGTVSGTASSGGAATTVSASSSICGNPAVGARSSVYAVVSGSQGAAFTIGATVTAKNADDDDTPYSVLAANTAAAGAGLGSGEIELYLVSLASATSLPVVLYLQPSLSDLDLYVSCDPGFPAAHTLSSTNTGITADVVQLTSCAEAGGQISDLVVYVKVVSFGAGAYVIGAFPLTSQVAAARELSPAPAVTATPPIEAGEGLFFTVPFFERDAPLLITVSQMDVDLDVFASCVPPVDGPAAFTSASTTVRSRNSGTEDDSVSLTKGDPGCDGQSPMWFAYIYVQSYRDASSGASLSALPTGGGGSGSGSGSLTTLWNGDVVSDYIRHTDADRVYLWVGASSGNMKVELDPDDDDLDLAVNCDPQFGGETSTAGGTSTERIELASTFFWDTNGVCGDGNAYVIVRAYGDSSSYTLSVGANGDSSAIIVGTVVPMGLLTVICIVVMRRRQRAQRAYAAMRVDGAAEAPVAPPPAAAAAIPVEPLESEPPVDSARQSGSGRDISAAAVALQFSSASHGGEDLPPAEASSAPPAFANSDGRCASCRGLIAPGAAFCSICGASATGARPGASASVNL